MWASWRYRIQGLRSDSMRNQKAIERQIASEQNLLFSRPHLLPHPEVRLPLFRKIVQDLLSLQDDWSTLEQNLSKRLDSAPRKIAKTGESMSRYPPMIASSSVIRSTFSIPIRKEWIGKATNSRHSNCSRHSSCVCHSSCSRHSCVGLRLKGVIPLRYRNLVSKRLYEISPHLHPQKIPALSLTRPLTLGKSDE